jgi:hypothetical protein
MTARSANETIRPRCETGIASADRCIKAGRKVHTARRKPLAPGSLGDRLVEIVTEAKAPVKRAHLDEHAGAKPYHVGLTLKDLVADQRLVTLGATSTRRYATPAMAKKES